MANLLTSSILLVPWMKYYWNCNPFLYDCKMRFMQQISTSMIDMPLLDVAKQATRILSRTKHEEALRANLEGWDFIPHYPWPPHGRAWHLGMQAGGVWMLGLFVHTTHHDLVDGRSKFYDKQLKVRKEEMVRTNQEDSRKRPGEKTLDKISKNANALGEKILSLIRRRWIRLPSDRVHLKPVHVRPSERAMKIFRKGEIFPKFKINDHFMVLSNSACRGLYRVMLWHNNPHHFLTGFVEAEHSSGKPWILSMKIFWICPQFVHLRRGKSWKAFSYVQCAVSALCGVLSFVSAPTTRLRHLLAPPHTSCMSYVCVSHGTR